MRNGKEINMCKIFHFESKLERCIHSLQYFSISSAFPSNPPQSQQNTFNAFPPANQAAPASSGQNAFAAFGTPATAAAQPTSQASFAAFGGTTMAPTPAAPVNQASKSLGDLSLSNSSPSQGLSNADKYSALSELDSIFSNPSGVSFSSILAGNLIIPDKFCLNFFHVE